MPDDARRRWGILHLPLLVSLVVDAAPAFPHWELPADTERILLVADSPELLGPGRILLRPDRDAAERLYRAGSVLVEDFPLPGSLWVDLELVAFDLLPGSDAFFARDGGGIRPVSGPRARFFRGQVAGDPNSLVSFNLLDGHPAGFVRTGGREYTFAPRSFGPGGPEAEWLEVVDDALAPAAEARCDGAEPHGDTVAGGNGLPALQAPQGIGPDTLLLGLVAVEGTLEWVNHHGGVTAAQSYTLNLMAQVSAVYEAEVNVQLQVPFILMNTVEPDGYTGGTSDTSLALNEMRAKWNGTPELQEVFRSLAHLFGKVPVGGGSGRAFLDRLCDNVPVDPNSRDYGVSLLEGNGGSFERRLVAHEIGHGFSSPHTHCYVPEIDQCHNLESGCYGGVEVQTTGTIMSYCDTRLTTFHPRARDETIRPGAEAAYPTCVEVAGSPGGVRDMGGSGGLEVNPAVSCPSYVLRNDDGGTEVSYGFSGTSQAAWIKRFAPPCYPAKLRRALVLITNNTVAVGRPLRVLVYLDPSGSGSPANATLVYTEDVTVQTVGGSTFNFFAFATPQVVVSGDVYVGFYDLVADASSTFIMAADQSRSGDSWWQSNGTDPAGFSPVSASVGSWMIRSGGGPVNAGSLALSWGAPCNDAEVPGQDFAVYQGIFGDWEDPASLTCTTGGQGSWLAENSPANSFWMVVPQNSANEGSYGLATSGERPPAPVACKPQSIGACP